MSNKDKSGKLLYYKEGDVVRVRGRDEIEKTLDQRSMTVGCLFVAQMYEYCGMEFEVIKTVKSFFDEHDYIVYRVGPPLYILDGAICRGDAGPFPNKYDHSCYLLWHQDWIEETMTPTRNAEHLLQDEPHPDTQEGTGREKQAVLLTRCPPPMGVNL